jgi:hypothetical protein
MLSKPLNDLVLGAVAGLHCDAYRAVIPSTQADMIQYQPSQLQKRGLGIRDWESGIGNRELKIGDWEKQPVRN